MIAIGFLQSNPKLAGIITTLLCFLDEDSALGLFLRSLENLGAWRLINEIWPEHEIWAVIDYNDYAESLQKHLTEHPMAGFHAIFQRMPRPMEKWLHARGPLEAIYYARWQEKLIVTAGRLHQQSHFDLVHPITYGRWWSPCGVRRLGLPFIWWPVGAANPTCFVCRRTAFSRPENSSKFAWK